MDRRRLRRLCQPTFMPVIHAVNNSRSFRASKKMRCKSVPVNKKAMQFVVCFNRQASSSRGLVGTLPTVVAALTAVRQAVRQAVPKPRIIRVIRLRVQPAKLILQHRKRTLLIRFASTLVTLLNWHADRIRYAAQFSSITTASHTIQHNKVQPVACICR